MNAIAIPAWLLRCFGSGPSVDVLLGDLREEYQQGRSAAWFWRQAITGVAVTFVADVGAHKLLTLRAVGLAWVIRVVSFVAYIYIRPWVRGVLAVFLPAHGPYEVSAYLVEDGTKVPHVFHIPWMTAVYEPLALIFLGTCLAWATGWVVARWHRQHTTSALLAIALTYVASWPIWTVSHPLGEVVIDVAWMNMLPLTSTALGVAFLFLGGLGRARRERAVLARDIGAR